MENVLSVPSFISGLYFNTHNRNERYIIRTNPVVGGIAVTGARDVDVMVSIGGTFDVLTSDVVQRRAASTPRRTAVVVVFLRVLRLTPAAAATDHGDHQQHGDYRYASTRNGQSQNHRRRHILCNCRRHRRSTAVVCIRRPRRCLRHFACCTYRMPLFCQVLGVVYNRVNKALSNGCSNSSAGYSVIRENCIKLPS